ncbi:CocE/NonD family hydrolase [Rhizorhabdus wittichii]|uniref:CocE/NonD family hydrolase n=1 Tax=Rhizorhabdus wittichii TaxID=160791 RepID=UPI0006832AD3|nr:CocE/NonD family hydrolase [Rhizorhabdus wittichii]
MGSGSDREGARNLSRRALLELSCAAPLAAGGGRALAATGIGQSPMGPREIRVIETTWVTMSDGTRLALRIVLPADADRNPVPAIIQYWPYRRRDITRSEDDRLFNYFASHGYACIHPDIRGSGDSEGVLKDEYLKVEQDDGLEIIAWVARQKWCTGKVGMTGLSWSGFSALQIAARRPPALEAILVHGCSDDRYADDAHYLGGTICQDMGVWGSVFFALQGYPPDPQVVGDRWRAMWRARCEGLDLVIADWLSHQTRDAFWKHGSVSEDHAAIQVPVYAIGGWGDGYPNAVPRLMEHLTVPRKALIGPWGHSYPHTGGPGPLIDYLTEARRWWDHWLKGVDTGIMEEPAYRAWMQDDAAHDGSETVAGRWVAEPGWPSSNIRSRRLFLNRQGLAAEPETGAPLTLAPHQTVGIAAGYWCPAGAGNSDLLRLQLPTDQRVDDTRSLVFDGAPLAERMEILGFPAVDLELSVDRPVALVAVRLDELHPDGTSRRISYGVLNLTHRDSHEHPAMLVPGTRYKVHVPMKHCSMAFKAGARLRVAISTSYWPLVFPSPEPVTLTLYPGASSLSLPVRAPRASDALLKPLGDPFVPPYIAETVLTPDRPPAMTVIRTGEVQTIENRSGGGAFRVNPVGTVLASELRDMSVIADDDPLSAHSDYWASQSFRRDDWNAKVDTHLSFRMTKDDYVVTATFKAWDGDAVFFEKSWEKTIPRTFS